MSPIPAGYFRSTYGPLRGRDWVRSLPVEERKALARIAFAASDYGRAGGRARSKAPRYPKGHPKAGQFMPNQKEIKAMTKDPIKRLEELRMELQAERISYGELAELQSLKDYIQPGDVELLEAAGVPEFETENS